MSPAPASTTTGRFQAWLATLPSTNLQTLVGLALASLAVIVLLLALVLHVELQEGPVDSVLLFIGALLGLSVGQFAVKRSTTSPEIMQAQAALDANTPLRTSTSETTTRTMESVPGAPSS